MGNPPAAAWRNDRGHLHGVDRLLPRKAKQIGPPLYYYYGEVMEPPKPGKEHDLGVPGPQLVIVDRALKRLSGWGR